MLFLPGTRRLKAIPSLTTPTAGFEAAASSSEQLRSDHVRTKNCSRKHFDLFVILCQTWDTHEQHSNLLSRHFQVEEMDTSRLK